jgi:non-ribosomal peptide synthetase component E (peptide arylation enzyme)
MILKGESAAHGPGSTLDELFRRAGVRAPQSLALIDPPNRQTFTDGAPRVLNFAEADRAISALAARLRGLGLATDTVVAIQLANTVEAVIALLGVLRAGMIAATMPLLWRQQDMTAALRGIGAKVILTCARIGDYAAAKTAMLAAADLFSVRHICAFGRDLPDGVVPLDGERAAAAAFVAPPTRPGQAGDHVAVITFDVTARGIVPVARNHVQLTGGGLVALLECHLAQQAAVLSAIPPASFAGITLGIVPWLLAGGTLALHHGCDPDSLAAQGATLNDVTAILPGPALAPLHAAAKLAPSIKTVLALWRAPERLAAAAPWTGKPALVDVAAFGEIGLLTARRGQNGLPAPIPHGSIHVPDSTTGALSVMQTARSRGGTLMLRGPMVPVLAYTETDGQEAGTTDPSGFIDTGFTCRGDRHRLILTGPPAGIVAVGGYRFRRQALDEQLAGLEPSATLVALPEASLGERLAGGGADPASAQSALQARGVNPLVSGAFRPRGEAHAA